MFFILFNNFDCIYDKNIIYLSKTRTFILLNRQYKKLEVILKDFHRCKIFNTFIKLIRSIIKKIYYIKFNLFKINLFYITRP